MKDEKVLERASSLIHLHTSAFILRPFFVPFFIHHSGVFKLKDQVLYIAQSVRDATFAPFLCQDAAHLLYRFV